MLLAGLAAGGGYRLGVVAYAWGYEDGLAEFALMAPGAVFLDPSLSQTNCATGADCAEWEIRYDDSGDTRLHSWCVCVPSDSTPEDSEQRDAPETVYTPVGVRGSGAIGQ